MAFKVTTYKRAIGGEVGEVWSNVYRIDAGNIAGAALIGGMFNWQSAR